MEEKIRKIILLSILLSFVWSINAVNGQTVVQQLKSNSQTAHFAKALEDANLHQKLKQSGPFTLLVPSNEAFKKLSESQKMNSNLLLNHIFTGMATKRSLKAMSKVTCLSGRTITIDSINEQELSIDSYKVLTFNIRADNGVIHIIDGVIK